MPGYLKSSLTLAQARDVAKNKFVECETTVLSSDKPPRFVNVEMVFLYATTSSGKKLSLVKPMKDNRKNRFVEVEKYHRFILLARRNTEEVFAMFTDLSIDSHNLLRYQSSLHPGVLVNVLNPKNEGFLRATNTTLLSTIEPLIPLDDLPAMNLTLPHSLEMASFRYFEFATTSLKVLSATATENVCPGKMCDGQTVLQNCGCLAVASKRIWALTILLECEELSPLEDVDSVSLTSNGATDLFVTAFRREQSPNSTDFDPFLLDEAVQKISSGINDSGGFVIKGWFKPNQTDDGATNDVKRVHVCSLRSKNHLSEELGNLKY